MSIIIGADIAPTKSNYELFSEGNAEGLVGHDLLEILRRAEYRIFNLETPLTDAEMPIPKSGPHLSAPCDVVNGYKALGIDLLTLANNHILDQNVQGLNSTIKTLGEAGIKYLGVGDTPNDASKPVILRTSGKRIGVYACAEHEFSIVSNVRPGANPYDPLESFDHVSELNKECDFVIVLYHGGREQYRYPSPMLQKVCRKFIEKGANLVLCQHTHCIGCEERYLSGTIVYGQGNFLFDLADNEFWKTGMLISIENDLTVDYIPVVKKHNGVRLAQKEEKERILADFHMRSEEIKNTKTVEEKYIELSRSSVDRYIRTLSGHHSLFFRAANRLSKGRLSYYLVSRKYKLRELLAIQNCFNCEAHRELLVSGITDRIEQRY